MKAKRSRSEIVANFVDATAAETAAEIDREVCYPIPPPDEQPVMVSWGVLRRLTDLAGSRTGDPV